MRSVRKFFSLVPALVLWLVLSVLIWGFVFTRITDTDPTHKLTLFIDAQAPGDVALAVRLEEGLGGNIRMVKVHPFSYAMLDGEQLKNADLYIIREDNMDTYREWLTPLPEDMRGEEKTYRAAGQAWGLLIYDAQAKTGSAQDDIQYETPGMASVNYYLCFGSSSRHLVTNENAADNAAVDAARLLLDGRGGPGL